MWRGWYKSNILTYPNFKIETSPLKNSFKHSSYEQKDIDLLPSSSTSPSDFLKILRRTLGLFDPAIDAPTFPSILLLRLSQVAFVAVEAILISSLSNFLKSFTCTGSPDFDKTFLTKKIKEHSHRGSAILMQEIHV